MYTGCHCPVTAGQKGGGGGFGKWTSVTPRGRKPIFPHPYYCAPTVHIPKHLPAQFL